MQEKQKGLFSNNRTPSEPDSSPVKPPHLQKEKRALISINLSGKGVLILIGIFVLCLEVFAPKEWQPSRYLFQWIVNRQVMLIEGIEQETASAEALKSFEVGNVENAILEERTQLVESINSQIERHKLCEAQKIQLANEYITRCINDGKSTYTECEMMQWTIQEQPCPEMPELTEQTRQLLEQYRQ